MLTPSPLPPQPAADVCGMFVVDAGGKIVAANQSAHQFWENTRRSFVGALLPRLFAADPAQSDEENFEAEWKAFKATALDRWTTRVTEPATGASRHVRFRLERAFGGAGTFIATVRPGRPED